MDWYRSQLHCIGVIEPSSASSNVLQDEFDDPSKPFPKRMAAHPELYDRVRTVVREGFLLHYGITVDS